MDKYPTKMRMQSLWLYGLSPYNVAVRVDDVEVGHVGVGLQRGVQHYSTHSANKFN